jgi:hypothetical protein
MKGLLFCAIFVFIQTLAPVAGVCQITENQYHYRDKIVLKNNHLLVGQIISYSKDSILLELNSSNQVTFHMSEVKKLIQYQTDEKISLPKLSVMKNPEKKHAIAGSYGIVPGFDASSSLFSLGIELSLLYKYNTHKGHVFMGGTGVDLYNTEVPVTYIPITLGYEYHIPVKMKSSLYLSIRTGYAFATSSQEETFEKNEGGWGAHPSLGMLFASNGKVGFFMEAGMKFQEASYSFGNVWWGRSEVDVIFRRYIVRFGIIF